MHIEFLVEEETAQIVLDYLLPTMLDESHSYEIRIFQGKYNLLKKLPERLRGYRAWLPDDWRIVVLVDEDRQDCRQLKSKLETIAHDAGFITKTSTTDGQFTVLNRIAVEEIEAWYFGDMDALRAAYPKLDAHLAQQSKYRDPDAIQGGTAEQLEYLLKATGDHPQGLEKHRAAHDIAPHMTPANNRSTSFQVFYYGLQALLDS